MIRREAVIVVLFISMLFCEIIAPNIYFMTFAPVVLFVIALRTYWSKIIESDFNVIFKDRGLWSSVLRLLKYTIIIQAAGNLFSKYILQLQPLDVSQYLLIITPLVAIFCSPVLEEIVFRKYIFGILDLKMNSVMAAVLSSIFFAICHANHAGWIGFFLIGMLWCYIYKKTGNILIPIIIHIALNTISFTVQSLPINFF